MTSSRTSCLSSRLVRETGTGIPRHRIVHLSQLLFMFEQQSYVQHSRRGVYIPIDYYRYI